MSEQQMTAYCMSCKAHREMVNVEATYTKTGTPGTRGKCSVCDTGMFKMGETPAHANVPKPEVIEKPKRKKPKRKKKVKRKRKTGKLVIVESPAKARSVGRYLGDGYTVRASKGHVRDLLKSRLSVDVDNGFEPEYRVPNDKRPTVKDLRLDVEGADEIYLATDPDREGEAIAWHLIAATEMDENIPLYRVVFHEITKEAVLEAFNHPREINMDLVNAQQARRILDRLVGYKITPLLWEKVLNNLSAGRVQSIALRMIVDREAEIEAFTSVEYWSIEADLRKQAGNNGKKADTRAFTAHLLRIEGETFELNSEEEVQLHLDLMQRSNYRVDEVKRGTRKRRSSPPYTTSTMQQEASRRLGFSTNRTMRLAQQLYEGIDLGKETVGLITYMRTDSTNVSAAAQKEARDYIEKHYGEDYRPEKPPKYKTKSKGAQEAHEAIRPTSVTRTPDSVKKSLLAEKDGKALLRLYTLIWQRFVASQMSDAIYNTLQVDIGVGPSEQERPYLFRVSGRTIRFKGFLALYEEAADDDAKPDADEGRIIPEMQAGDLLDLLELKPEQHFTQPPPRYTEASLIKVLEEYGIGRPSTYAPTVRVIQDRSYVEKDGKRMVPTDIGRKVTGLLMDFFPEVLDYSFTAKMEDQLDEIADGQTNWRPMLAGFYEPFEARVENAQENMPEIRLTVGRKCPTCETGDLVIKSGRFGMFVGCSNYPECKHTERYVEHTGIICPQCGEEHGGEIVGPLKTGRGKRPFYGCSRYPDCDFTTWKLPKVDEEGEAMEELQRDAS
jgi:DNA topoisomerase I